MAPILSATILRDQLGDLHRFRIVIGIRHAITPENSNHHEPFPWSPLQFSSDHRPFHFEWTIRGLYFHLRFSDDESESSDDLSLLHRLSQRPSHFGHLLSDPIYFVFHRD